jgi:antitoxin component YwqK of YwqJK toxin-antitoxin module
LLAHIRRCRAQYRGGKRAGLWTFWFPGGKVQALGEFSDDFEDGHWVYWNEQGQRAEEGHYRRGERTGLWRVWPADGGACKEVRYA